MNYRCPGRKNEDFDCDAFFKTGRGLQIHLTRSGHCEPYFRYAKHISRASVTCAECGYCPARFVDNPKKCYTDHLRRRHRLLYMQNRRPYVIIEEP